MKIKIIIIQIIAFISLSTTVFAQNKKLDSLFGEYEGSVMKASKSILQKYNYGCTFSIKVIVDKKGNVKSFSISDNIEKSLSNDFFLKNKSKLNLAYFTEIAKYDKLKSDATYISLVALVNSTPENINIEDGYKLPFIFKYDGIEGNLRNVTLIKPCVMLTGKTH